MKRKKSGSSRTTDAGRPDTGLPMSIWPEGSIWYRIHAATRDAAWFGPKPGGSPINRFDDPQGEYRICYLGASIEASFAETLLRNPHRRTLSLSDLQARRITSFRLGRPVKLVRVRGNGLAQLGVTADIVHAPGYEQCGEMARHFWAHPAAPDGLEYRARHDNDQLCIALFDRAADALVPETSEGLADDIPRLIALLRHYKVGL